MSSINITTEDLRSASRAASEAALSIAGGTAFFLRMIDNIAYLAIHEDYKNPDALIYSSLTFFTLLSIADGWVHFKIYNHGRYDEQHDDEGAALVSKVSALPAGHDEHHHHLEFSWSAFLCTLSCSVDSSSVAVVIMTLLRGADILGPIDPDQRIVELAASGLMVGLSLWNAPRKYRMAKEHLCCPGHH